MTAASELLAQDEFWIGGRRIDDMTPGHRSNLIPFLRGNKVTLHRSCTGEDATPAEAEEWLLATPLMQRLVAGEQGRPLEERRQLAERNAEFEAETGYEKVRYG